MSKLTDKITQVNIDKPDFPDDIFSNLDLETVRRYLEHAEITAFSESCQVKTFTLYMDYYRGIDFIQKFNFVQKISLLQSGRVYYVKLGKVVLNISYNDAKFISNHNICDVRLLIGY